MSASLAEVGHLLRTQDDACTRDPMFVVQQRKRIYGMDGDYTDAFVWITDDADHAEADAEEAAKLEAAYENGEDTDGWDRVAYFDTWEFVQPFFTRAAAEAFIATNAHRLTDPQIEVDTACRNPEWQAVREHLMALEAPAAAEKAPDRCPVTWCGTDSTKENWSRCMVRNRRCFCSAECAQKAATEVGS